jgi:hypothetical protein
MRIRRIALSVSFAAILMATAVRGYAVSLSQLLGGGEDQKLDTFKLINVADLKALLANPGHAVHVYDANIEATRKSFGTIPGAILLPSDLNYPLALLPANKHATLVFYCANRH